MEQELRFGLDLGWLALLKKKWANYEQILRPVFSCFHGNKKFRKIKNSVASGLKSCIKWSKKYILFVVNYQIQNSKSDENLLLGKNHHNDDMDSISFHRIPTIYWNWLLCCWCKSFQFSIFNCFSIYCLASDDLLTLFLQTYLIVCIVNTWSERKIDMFYIGSLVIIGWFLPLLTICICYLKVKFFFITQVMSLIHTLILKYFKI